MIFKTPNTSTKRVEPRYDVNHDELYIPIDHRKLVQEHEVQRGTISWSDTFDSWVIVGHPTIDMICIDAPYKEGDIYTTELIGKQFRFNGMKVSRVCIKQNRWCIIFNEYWSRSCKNV